MTQRELASYLGVSDQSLVSKWERGRKLPQAEKLQRIAQLDGRGLEVFLAGGVGTDRRRELSDEAAAEALQTNRYPETEEVIADTLRLQGMPRVEKVLEVYRKVLRTDVTLGQIRYVDAWRNEYLNLTDASE